MGKILAIDYGSVRIGIAVSGGSGSIAFGKQALSNDNKAIGKIKKLVSGEGISQIILGYPLNLKGEKTHQTLEVESFEEKLKSGFSSDDFKHVIITRWDERFTSKMAADSMIESGMKKKKRRDKSNIDIISAAILLQSYLDSKRK
ncbi:MAG: Holliday junction resolvase RuvX [Chlorobi bacterium]|nr:Holliday junction resolvase RuvX [Chlorobiota bacterium]MCI0717199.1 Holliday junction resolvase RuvX [Chlorobiota bacterium]